MPNWKKAISEFCIINITITELLRVRVEAGQKRPSTFLDVILKYFEQASLYTPRKIAFSLLVNMQVSTRLCYIEQHQQNTQLLLGRVR